MAVVSSLWNHSHPRLHFCLIFLLARYNHHGSCNSGFLPPAPKRADRCQQFRRTESSLKSDASLMTVGNFPPHVPPLIEGDYKSQSTATSKANFSCIRMFHVSFGALFPSQSHRLSPYKHIVKHIGSHKQTSTFHSTVKEIGRMAFLECHLVMNPFHLTAIDPVGSAPCQMNRSKCLPKLDPNLRH
jgi:hypothetical protein